MTISLWIDIKYKNISAGVLPVVKLEASVTFSCQAISLNHVLKMIKGRIVVLLPDDVVRVEVDADSEWSVEGADCLLRGYCCIGPMKDSSADSKSIKSTNIFSLNLEKSFVSLDLSIDKLQRNK